MKNITSNPFEGEGVFTPAELSDLTDAVKRSEASNTTLETIAQNRAQLKTSEFTNINLDRKQLAILVRSAEYNLEHAKLSAIYLWQMLQQGRQIDLVKYHAVLWDIYKRDNNPHALFLLADSQLTSQDSTMQLIGKHNMQSLQNDPFYGKYVKERISIEDVASPSPATSSTQSAFVKKQHHHSEHLAMYAGQNNAKKFIDLVESIIATARKNKITAALFDKVDAAREAHTQNGVLNYTAMLGELHMNTQSESLIKMAKKFAHISAQTTPQSKTIVRAITQYYTGDQQGAIKVLTDFRDKGKVPEPSSKENKKSSQDPQKTIK